MNKQTHETPLLIIGAGPAGYTAAIYAARAGLKPILVTGMQPGGQLTVTTDVENYPGFAETIQGPWLMEQMQAQAAHVGVEIVYDAIAQVDFHQRPFISISESGTKYVSQSVIICTGAQAKWLNIPGEGMYRGFGVSACATCDGFFFKDKTVAVIGGGNTAVEEALYLTHHVQKVILIHRRDQLKAEKILQERLHKNGKIRVLWNRIVEEIAGEDNPKRATHLVLSVRGESQKETLPIEGVFVAIGHAPATEIFTASLALDAHGYIQTSPKMETSIPGIFAAGDVQDAVYRQAVTAAGQGCMAALEAERFLSSVNG